jgi:proteic killer suppression protein
MIQSFADTTTERLFRTEKCRRFQAISRVALRKLIQMNRARVLQDLAVPPGNRLKALKGELAGYYSIRVNQQWRITFLWTENGPSEVSIVDYH